MKFFLSCTSFIICAACTTTRSGKHENKNENVIQLQKNNLKENNPNMTSSSIEIKDFGKKIGLNEDVIDKFTNEIEMLILNKRITLETPYDLTGYINFFDKISYLNLNDADNYVYASIYLEYLVNIEKDQFKNKNFITTFSKFYDELLSLRYFEGSKANDGYRDKTNFVNESTNFASFLSVGKKRTLIVPKWAKIGNEVNKHFINFFRQQSPYIITEFFGVLNNKLNSYSSGQNYIIANANGNAEKDHLHMKISKTDDSGLSGKIILKEGVIYDSIYFKSYELKNEGITIRVKTNINLKDVLLKLQNSLEWVKDFQDHFKNISVLNENSNATMSIPLNIDTFAINIKIDIKGVIR